MRSKALVYLLLVVPFLSLGQQEKGARALNKNLATLDTPQCIARASDLLKQYEASRTEGYSSKSYKEWQELIQQRAQIAKRLVYLSRAFFNNLDQLVDAEEKNDPNSTYEIFRADEFRKKSYVQQAIEKTSEQVNLVKNKPSEGYIKFRLIACAIFPASCPLAPAHRQTVQIQPTSADVWAYYRGQRNQIVPTLYIRQNKVDYTYEIAPFRAREELAQYGKEVLHGYGEGSSYFDQQLRREMELRIVLRTLGELELFTDKPIRSYVRDPVSPSYFVHSAIEDKCWGDNVSRVVTQEMLDALKAADEEDTEEKPKDQAPDLHSLMGLKPISLVGLRQVPLRVLDGERLLFIEKVATDTLKELGDTPAIGRYSPPAPRPRAPAPPQGPRPQGGPVRNPLATR